MKYNIYLITVIFLLSACGSSKYIAGNTTEDKILATAMRKLDKNPNDTSLQNSLKYLYNDAALAHLNNIERLEQLNSQDKWNKIISEYQSLERLSEIIKTSNIARRFVNAPSYLNEIQSTRTRAAEIYYQAGMDLMDHAQDKISYREAYQAFQKANSFISGYKDVKRQMNDAYQSGILNVVINPVTDNSPFYYSIGTNRFGNSFNDDRLQRTLVRELGGDYNRNSAARFYTEYEARRANVDADWFVDIMWTNLDIPRPLTNQFTREVSKKIEDGKDSTGKMTYKTVYATLHLTKRYFTAQGDLENRVTDAVTRRTVDVKRYTARVDWSQEYGTYKGDSRALSDNDWIAINMRNPVLPTREEILNGLFDKMFPQLKNGIQNLVKW